MADRKGRSVLFKLPRKTSVGRIKRGISDEIADGITVFQDLGNNEFLIELQTKAGADLLIEEGFDMDEVHVCCHPPHGFYTNVSILGLRSYVDDLDVKDCLSQFGEVKGEVIRLKYKADHDLAGIENGNRLVKMVLGARSIPYSMRIGGDWCRVIHNNQQPVCNECHEEGHTRKKCPQIECRICKQKGHMSYICDKKKEQHGDDLNPVAGDTGVAVDNSAIVQEPEPEGKPPTEPVITEMDDDSIVYEPEAEGKPTTEPVITEMDDSIVYDETIQGKKRPHSSTDSDSEWKVVGRRQRLRPVPNIENARHRVKKTENNVSDT